MLLRAKLVMLLMLFFITNKGLSQHVVEYLPGFPTKLPFKLETGYVGVGEKEDVQLFYYFFESESKPEDDPLVLWLTGGPGCSGLSDLVYSNGPFTIDDENSNGSIPTLILNKYTWTKVANIIFIDQPVGAGFSYAKIAEASYTSDTSSATFTYDFLRKWLISHAKFQKNPLYICGDSYSGMILPLVVNQVYNGIEEGHKPKMNMKGYVLGNSLTDKYADINERIMYAHRMGLLSDKLYQSAKINCNGNYIYVDTENELCLNDLKRVTQCLDKITDNHILEPFCGVLWKDEEISTSFIQSVVPTAESWCRDHTHILLHAWANTKSVQKALNIHEGTITEWIRCNRNMRNNKTLPDGTILYIDNIPSTVKYHKKLTYKNCRALVYSGDHDMKIPHISTEKWIESILTIQSDWRPWFVEGQIAGYAMTYEHGDYQLTYATVKGAGHIAPEYKPNECFAMINRWFAQSSL